MKHSLLSALFILSALFSFAQKEANVWYFGDQAGVSFNSGSPVSLSNGAIYTNEGCASLADKTSGQSLFYTDGSTIYNRNNAIMTNGTGLLGNTSSTQSAVIVPKPGSATLFYVFTADAQDGYQTGNQGKFCYNVVDMTQSGGLGSVTIKNQVLMTGMTEKIAAYPHCNGLDIWVVAHQWSSNAFYAYLVTSAGVSAPVISNTGAIHQDNGSGSNDGVIGYMKISPDGTMIGVACDWYMHLVQAFPFNNSTGAVGAPLLTDSTTWTVSPFEGGPYGLSFSPDSRLLYAAVEGGNNVYQYNMKAGNSAAILATKLQVGIRATNGTLGALQIGPDGKMYVAETQTAALGVINNPNTLGLGCNFVESAVTLTANCAYGLPDIVESFLIPQYTATLTYTGCSGNSSVDFTDSTLNGTITCLWNFGDALSGTSDSSSLQNPIHTFSSSGTYTVTLYLTNHCGTDTLSQSVTISGTNNATATPADTAFCAGGYAQLQASGGSTYRWSPGTGLSDSTIANPIAYPTVSTSYTVTVSPIPCADSIATVNIVVFDAPPTPDIKQSSDTLFCSYDPTYTSYQWYYNDTLIVGATDSLYIASQDGNYNVAVTNENGCQISVGINIVLGIQSLSSANGSWFTISPNPAGRELRIKNEELRIEKIEIYNELGQNVYAEQPELRDSNQETVINVSAFSTGIYFVRIANSSLPAGWVGRFVKE